jgi:hypothetical protein
MTVTFRSRPISLALTGAVLVLVAAGCGGSSKSNTGASSTSASAAATPASPTKTEFVAKANSICTRTNGPLAATALKLASHPSPPEAVHIISTSFIPEIQGQLSEIKALGTPTGGQATIATMDRLLAGDIAKIEKNPALAGPAAFHDFAKVAHGYGLIACAPLS